MVLSRKHTLQTSVIPFLITTKKQKLISQKLVLRKYSSFPYYFEKLDPICYFKHCILLTIKISV